MFCPRCGHEIPSDRVKFCTHCRFPINLMKEFIVTQAARYDQDEDENKSSSPRQLDIIVGAALMIAGVILSVTVAVMFTNKFLFAGVTTLLLVFTSVFALFLLSIKSSPRRQSLSLGAKLVFISNLIATLFAKPTEGISFLVVAAIAIPVILLWT